MSILIDDSDVSVQYNSPGSWQQGGQAGLEFEGTTHTSATPGDTATLAFEGTSISVYGTVAASTGQSRMNFSIDGYGTCMVRAWAVHIRAGASATDFDISTMLSSLLFAVALPSANHGTYPVPTCHMVIPAIQLIWSPSPKLPQFGGGEPNFL